MAATEAAAAAHGRRLTARGAATRDRIVQAAADLIYVRGVNATTLDDIRAATGTSKSQLYRHFPDKDALIHAVIALRGRQVLERETRRLGRLSSFSGLTRWRDALVQANALQDGAYGCALGSMASELADTDEQARASLAGLFRSWEGLLAAGLRRMQAQGTIGPDADPDRLAVGLMAALQGGYLLASTARDVRPMEIALDLALAQVKSCLSAGYRCQPSARPAPPARSARPRTRGQVVATTKSSPADGLRPSARPAK
jgi:TetR/AcrR family transcriptional regulator, transcriptional repressor for nem operon